MNKTAAIILAALFLITLGQPAIFAEDNQPKQNEIVKFESAPGRWEAERAWGWYNSHKWQVGANYVPSTAINQLEMWQAETFDPQTIDRELKWASDLGMNTMRIFLHDIPWRTDSDGFYSRIDKYLEIADKHQIKTMFVLFDGVWNPMPQAGKQPEPRKGLHNSGWVQGPGKDILNDPQKQDELKGYVTGVIGRYKDDQRVLAWDLFNEPDNINHGSYGQGSEVKSELEPNVKSQRAHELLTKSFKWAREVNPSQPITVGIWGAPNWLTHPSPIVRTMIENSDIISFHSYHDPAGVRPIVENLVKLGRPLMCTEYIARGIGSTFDGVMPILKQHKVAAYCWGLVSGKSQTIYPWNSWDKPYENEPEVWFHDIFTKDGKPFSDKEVEFIKKITEKCK